MQQIPYNYPTLFIIEDISLKRSSVLDGFNFYSYSALTEIQFQLSYDLIPELQIVEDEMTKSSYSHIKNPFVREYFQEKDMTIAQAHSRNRRIS